jgi:hypothetical protein
MCGACRSNREAKRSGSLNEASITAASSEASGTGRVVRPVMGVLASSALLGRRDRPRASTAGGLYLFPQEPPEEFTGRHGLASHHLRQLAKYGFVEQVKGKDHRERPWRLVATSYNWTAATATAEGSTAVDVLEQVLAEQALEDFLGWQQRRKEWPTGWRASPCSRCRPPVSEPAPPLAGTEATRAG